MKFLGKLILWLLVTLLLVIIGAWFLLQTHWGARQASAWLSNGTGWQVSFDEMEHDFSSPLHVQLRNVTFGREGKPATLVAKTVDIGFSTRQFSDPLHADEIVLNDGTLNLSPHSADLPFAADRSDVAQYGFQQPGNRLGAQRAARHRRRQPMDAGGGQCAGKNGADPDERGLDDAQWRRSQQRSDSG